jgi:NADP-dependent aldehyde dehydrogenase
VNQPILVKGKWVQSTSAVVFRPIDPNTGKMLDDQYPLSTWGDCEKVLDAAGAAFDQLQRLPRQQIARFLDSFADRIEAQADSICQLAHLETGLPLRPRLLEVELPRTVRQLRLAGECTSRSDWCRPTIDTINGIRSMHRAVGPVAVFGPNNFPLAFGSASGGDFAAAIAAGNPVIAKANSSHPGTTKLFAEQAQLAADVADLPPGTVQLIYRLEHVDGERLVSDQRLAAVGYTGSRSAGLRLKQIADRVGKPIYLELSSINPVVILPGAIRQRGEAIAEELAASCLMGCGQFCTSPGIVFVLAAAETESFIEKLIAKIKTTQPGVLLSAGVRDSLDESVRRLVSAGATLVCGGHPLTGQAIRYANTLLSVDGHTFLDEPVTFQTEAFGNAILLVSANDLNQLSAMLVHLEGNLTGSIYSHQRESEPSVNPDDDAMYRRIEPILRRKVGRLLNDKMPTGVAVSAAMNHGGPFPATGHPGFTAVGLPAAITRFSALQCYDNVRNERLPVELQDQNPRQILRFVNGNWTVAPIG